jgi:hypothetical protein
MPSFCGCSLALPPLTSTPLVLAPSVQAVAEQITPGTEVIAGKLAIEMVGEPPGMPVGMMPE